MEKQIEIPMEIPKSKNIPRPDWDSLKEEYWGYVTEFVDEWGIGRYKSKENNLEDIKEILDDDYETQKDAYELAKKFEDEGWSVDASFVDTLGSLDSFEQSDVYRTKIKAWIEATEMEPTFLIGDAIKNDTHRKLYVKKIMPDLRRYFCTKEPDGRMGYYINWEDAQALNTEPA